MGSREFNILSVAGNKFTEKAEDVQDWRVSLMKESTLGSG